MVGSRAMLSVIALLLASLVVAPASHAQEPEFILLGTDPADDSTLGGQNHPDTASDVIALSVMTDGDNLVFRMDLTSSSTEIGSFCYLPAFEHKGTEYAIMSCFEMTLAGDSQTLSEVEHPSTSRGANVDHVAELRDNAVYFTIPLANLDAAHGDSLDDIYGLVYTTRARAVTDFIPDAKSDVAAAESLGSYIIGTAAGAGDLVETVQAVFQNLTEPSFLHDLENATSNTYTLNFTVPWQNITLDTIAAIHTGSANVTVLRDGELLSTFLLNNETSPVASDDNSTRHGNETAPDAAAEAPALMDMAGNWTIVIVYENFTGILGMTILEYVPAMADEPLTNVTSEPVLAANEDAPGPALPLLVFGLLAAVFVVRRRLN